MIMEEQGFFLLIPLVITLIIAVLLLCRGERAYQRINRAFSLWVIAICFWYLQLITETLTSSEKTLEVLFHISLMGQWIIPSLFLYFVFCFIHEKMTLLKGVFLVIPAVFFLSLVIFDMCGVKLVIATIRYNAYGAMGRSVVYMMPAFLGWLVYFLVFTIRGAWELIGHLLRTTVAFRDKSLRSLGAQSNFLLAAAGVLIFILGLTLDIIIPIFNSRVFPISSVTTLVMVVLMGWLLLRVEQ